jgi:hypothetical protein
MNPDQTPIHTAYGLTLQRLYAALFDAYMTAAGDATQEQQADQRFAAGLEFARKSRDRALALLG